MLIIAGVSASQGSFSTIPQPENMSTSSGKLGECRACGHMNNEQSYHKCTVCKKGTLGKSVKPLLHTQIPRGLLHMVNAKVVVVVADHFPVLSMI